MKRGLIHLPQVVGTAHCWNNNQRLEPQQKEVNMKPTLLTLIFLVLCQPGYSQYYGDFAGKIQYKNGHEQSFNGLRCFWSGRLYYSSDADTFKKDYREAPSLHLDQVERIDLKNTFVGKIRLGSVKFVNGKLLEDVYLYLEECKWADYDKVPYTVRDNPTLEGSLADPSIVSIVISKRPVRQ
jgi:hypothetical protein